MKDAYTFHRIPKSRVATMDTFTVGLQKHHVGAMLEFDVSEARRKLQELRRKGIRISFNGWLLKVIGSSIQKHPEAAAFLYSKKKLILFRDMNISILVEKQVGGNKVPIPVVIEKANEKSAGEITAEIERAKVQGLASGDMVIHRRTAFYERLYYHLPGFLRRLTWRMILRNPRFAYSRMGNVVVTPVGMMGRIQGWFIHTSVHPLSFGVGSVLKKPVVLDNEIKIRDILNMTVLVDHDVIDGAPMVRFLHDLTRSIESGEFLDSAGTHDRHTREDGPTSG